MYIYNSCCALLLFQETVKTKSQNEQSRLQHSVTSLNISLEICVVTSMLNIYSIKSPFKNSGIKSIWYLHFCDRCNFTKRQRLTHLICYTNWHRTQYLTCLISKHFLFFSAIVWQKVFLGLKSLFISQN